MDLLTDAKEVILKLKEVKKEKNLSVDDIVAMLEENNEFVSKSTVARVFQEGSEHKANSFRYENSLRPIANVLLEIDTDEQDDNLTTQAFKTILRYKMEMIEKSEKRIAELEEEVKIIKDKERSKYNKKLDDVSNNFEKSIGFAKEQIRLKDERIDNLLTEIDKLTVTIQDVVGTNNKLVQQMMRCPLKKEEG